MAVRPLRETPIQAIQGSQLAYLRRLLTEPEIEFWTADGQA